MPERFLNMANEVFSIELEGPVVGPGNPPLFHFCVTQNDVGLSAFFDWFSIWQLVHEGELYLRL
jgi:hypothetical protein